MKEFPQIEYRESEDRLSLLKNISRLSEIDSPSTAEDEVRNYLIEELNNLGIESKTDEKGNLWVISNEPEGEIVLSAHMDKVGSGVPLIREADQIKGRLDNAIGMSIILEAMKSGLRPSVVFTVEEECEREENGDIKMRELPNGFFNAGARQASSSLLEIAPKTKLVIIIDVSAKANPGSGPLIYQSGTPPKGGTFRFPSEPLKDIIRLLRKEGIEANYLHGNANDAIEFTFVPNMGVTALEVPIYDIHSSKEQAEIEDINNALNALKVIIKNHDKINQPKGKLPHTEKGETIKL